ncbi:MAG TPA: ABC transporter permease [Actinospica sp.]|nr:ABC transporter permease [Actinospica sp.]
MSPAAAPRRKPLLILVSLVALPVVVALAVVAFAWPAARLAPRDLPLGVVGSSPAGASLALALEQAEPGAFTVTLYGSDAAARAAIENREVYGALEPAGGRLTVLTASAAGPTVAQLIVQVGDGIAAKSAAHGKPLTVAVADVVPSSPNDPRGVVLSSALLPMTICSTIIASAIAILVGIRPAWRQVLTLAIVCALTGLSAYLVAQGCLGALPGRHLETWAALALAMFSMSATIAGFIALFGPRGMGIGAVLLVFLGNPFSGVTSAPELLPGTAAEIGRLLPPGAGASLLRDTAYFHGHGPAEHLVVLIGWSLFGIVSIFLGHHSFIGHAARSYRESRSEISPIRSRETERIAPLARTSDVSFPTNPAVPGAPNARRS